MAVETLIRPGLGECRVETGTGIVELTDQGQGRRNVQVEIKATHTELRHPVKAWVDTQAVIYQAVLDAADKRAEVAYEITVHRRRGVDLETPFAELDNTQKVRDLTAIRPSAAPELEHESPREDLGYHPPPSGADRARAIRATYGLEEPPPEYDEPPNLFVRSAPAEPPAASTSPHPRPTPSSEAAGQDNNNSDAVPPAVAARMTTWGYLAALGMVELAYELVLEQGQGVDQRRVKVLAKSLLEAVDEAQRRTFGRLDRADHSHSRARGALRTALRAHPVPFGADGETRARWSEDLTAETAAILRLGLELLD